ncbi:SusC/RagA family TonB-linked outer membrane protein [Niabella aurantiaca]|uniref:SusC/RagA family TonB-linked outer membrane protein n=1 Tax=Niabella aurantiaca TaxID=379900 RepID=UPI00036E838D|nr:SusC/RagA family TonB-linked outer membrane protein [Niabella aurantiaca]
MIRRLFGKQKNKRSRRALPLQKAIFLFYTVVFLSVSAMAQNGAFRVSGKVTDSTSQPVAGASIVEKDGKAAATADAGGAYSITVSSPAATLVFSNVGYKTLEIAVDKHATIDVLLEKDVVNMNEVVVTALGISRKAKSLTYSTQVVSGERLTHTKDVNVMNNLVGKVSGVQINRSSSGPGGSVNIVLRGLKSPRNNQPLYIVDGLPITNTEGSGPAGALGGAVDRGDILSTLNADDIASVNVLKGANASALYGSQGANGAILITTKKGVAGVSRIDISSMATVEEAFYLPRLQFTYGQTPNPKGGVSYNEESWGPKGAYKDHVKDFFNKGATLINSIALSGGNDKMQNYFSYANITNKGIMPTERFKQNTVTYRNTTRFFNNRLTFDGSIMYASQKIHNRAASGLNFGVLAGLYMFPRGLDFEDFKNNYQYLSPERNIYLQNWFNINAAGQTGTNVSQNPYWVLNKNPTDQSRENIIATASLKYAVNDWLNLSARGTLNKMWNKFERRVYAGTQGASSGQIYTDPDNSKLVLLPDNGRYMRDEGSGQTMYGDLLLNGQKTLADDMELGFTLGASINDIRSSGWSIDIRRMNTANAFLLNNIYRDQPITNFRESFSRQQVQSVFASANLGYKELLYLDLTARNDWSSTLAGTPSEKSGYFYYSAGISTLLNEFIKMPSWVNLGKLRFSYASTGNGVQQFTSMIPAANFGSGEINVNNSGIFNNEPLKPELSKSLELGLEGRFMDNRLSLDAALYESNTKNQFFSFQGPVGMLNTTLFINAGNVENKGIEIALDYKVIRGERFEWNTAFNYTANRNKVLELNPKLGNTYPIGSSYNVLRVGGSFGDLWGPKFLRNDKGQIIVSNDSVPMTAPAGYLGTSNPSAIVGWVNRLKYKKLLLSFTIDGRFGGKVVSNTQGFLNAFGYSQESADAREQGGVAINGARQDGTPVTMVPAIKYYHGIGNRNGIAEGQLYDATNIRLRELSLVYQLPLASKFIKSASVGLVGRNLFFFRNDAPYDPEVVTTTDEGGSGFDIFGLPPTRSYGLNLKLRF